MAIAIIYHSFPHYRAGVFEELADSAHYNYIFVGSRDAVDATIKTWLPTPECEVIYTRNITLPGGLKWQLGLWRIIFRKDISSLIMLGEGKYLSSWLVAILARIYGKKVYFWTHGWLRNNTGLRGWFKDRFYNLADGLFLYGHRAESIALSRGYLQEKLSVIYNSINVIPIEQVVVEMGLAPVDVFSGMFEEKLPVVICTARLTPQCRFDLLIAAAAILKARMRPINILLIGDGPARVDLERQAGEAEVSMRCFGACYDEVRLASFLYSADVLVSPGKIGLSAIHSLAYGTPAISHNDFDFQGPEFEAILPGVTGDFFSPGDVLGLAQKIEAWIGRVDREIIRANCVGVVRSRYNAVKQRELIEAHLEKEGVVL